MYPEPRGQEFEWSEEHRELRAAVRGLLTDRAPVARARELAEAGERHDPALWSTLATDIGLHGMAVPEDLGGVGGTLVDLAIVVEEMGRVLFGGPFLSTVCLATPALLASGDTGACQDYLPRITRGELTATLAVDPHSPASVTVTVTAAGDRLTGSAGLVPDGADADVLLVPAHADGEIDLFVIDRTATGLRTTALETLDGTRRLAHVRLDGAAARRIGAPGEGWAAVAKARAVGSVLMAAEQVGGMAACVELTAAYARTRQQFGRLIGSFQGVKHRLADMAVQHELARAATYWAAWQDPAATGFDTDFDTGALVARAACSPAYLQIALDTVQLHGGIGFTWEHDAHLYVRRARADKSLLGTPAHTRAALEPAVLASAGLSARGAEVAR